MRLVAGVDAGGSTTVVALSSSDSLEIVARHVGDPAPLRPSGVNETARTIAATVERALANVGDDPTLSRVVVGVAGAGRDDARAGLEAALGKSLGCSVRVCTDAEIAHRAVFHGEPGTILLVGTGAIALARDSDGRWHRVGGYGSSFADEIGGFNIGRSALAAVGQAHDGRGPPTLLTDHVRRLTGCEDFDALVSWTSDASYDGVAALAAAVMRAASDGDASAIAIVEAATGHLVAYIARAVELSARDAPIALAGGLMQEGSVLREAVTTALQLHLPEVTVLPHAADPVLGALELALANR